MYHSTYILKYFAWFFGLYAFFGMVMYLAGTFSIFAVLMMVVNGLMCIMFAKQYQEEMQELKNFQNQLKEQS